MLVRPLCLVALALFVSGPAEAMTLKECSVKYQDAKKTGTLNGQNWSDFRSAQCGMGKAVQEVAATAATPAAPADPATAQPAAAAPASPKQAAAPAPAPANLSLPSVIDPKYAAEKPSKARLHTCADAYRVAKKAGSLQGFRWIQKGGGFYSLCNRKLKAAG